MEKLMFSAKGFYHDNSVSEFWVYDREKYANAVTDCKTPVIPQCYVYIIITQQDVQNYMKFGK